MSLSLLKYNTDVLLEVAQQYELFLQKRTSVKGEGTKLLDFKLRSLQNQILALLSAIKKEVGQEKNG